MDLTDLPWQDIERIADITANALEIAGAGVVVTVWIWRNRQKIAAKIRLTKAPGRHIRVQVTDTLGMTDRVSAEVTSTWNIHALVGSERQALWNVEARNRTVDLALEAASWVLPEIVRSILR